MTDWNKLWQEINEKTAQGSRQEPLMAAADLRPAAHNILAAILRRTRLKLYLIYAYLLLVGLALIGWYGQGETRIILLIMFFFGLVNLALVLPPYREMQRRRVSMAGSLLKVLEFYRHSLHTMLRRENLLGILFTPFSAMLGFLWAFIEKNGTATGVFADPRLLTIMVITGIIMAPLGGWMVRWMNQKSFGPYLEHLQNSLDDLRAE